jgi:uncharacterized protein YprB with RNaseH-like and TPR domain
VEAFGQPVSLHGPGRGIGCATCPCLPQAPTTPGLLAIPGAKHGQALDGLSGRGISLPRSGLQGADINGKTTLIRKTFQLTRGIGPSRERELWARGISSWDDFPRPGGGVAFSVALDERIRSSLEQGNELLARRDLRGLSALFPSRERWRLYREFAHDAVFFDIETDATREQCPTVVSLFTSAGIEVFIRGQNLERVPEALARWPIWVTFNGLGFDVPVLKRHFPSLPEPIIHLDLRHLCRRLELMGGLKKIETLLGFGRPPHLLGVDGYDAVLLWRAFERSGSPEQLRLLVEYNIYDSLQLRTLMDTVYNRAIERLGVEAPLIEVFDRGDVLYDISRYLLTLSAQPDSHEVLARVRDGTRTVSDD